jgi:hypothetical protein
MLRGSRYPKVGIVVRDCCRLLSLLYLVLAAGYKSVGDKEALNVELRAEQNLGVQVHCIGII